MEDAVEFCIDRNELDALMPMNLQLDDAGVILHVGPTLARTRGEGHFLSKNVFDLFEFKRPKGISTTEELRRYKDIPLRLTFKDGPRTGLRGSVAPTLNGGGFVLNLSFGLSILDAIKQYDLHSGDFATTDPTIEMLYLIEAKSAAMEESRDLNMRLQGAKIAAEEQAFTDTLTGLKNRRAMDHVLARYCEQGVEFVLMGVDLDFFKRVNDTFGHAAGDHVLQRVARVMVQSTRPTDTLVRNGGDEFLIVLKDMTDTSTAAKIAEKLIALFEEPIPFENNICQISASIGIASTAWYSPVDTTRMMNDVDAALYESKRNGKGQATVFQSGLEIAPKSGDAPNERVNARVQPR